MANRFNQYQNVDYVNMPIAAYQMVASAKEGEYQTHLDAAKSTFDQMNAIQASANPDKLLKESIMTDVRDKISGMAGKNLKTADALMELGQIVSNPDHISKLAGIYGNTLDVKEAEEANKKHIEEYGTDINTQQYTDQFAAYNKLGKEGFKAGVFSGYSPGKYLDIIPEVQKALDKMKADGWQQSPKTDGMWVYKGGKEEVSLERALSVAGLQLQDPKYQAQLQKIAYSGLRGFGAGTNGMPAALTAYKAKMIEGVDEDVVTWTATIAKIKAEDAKNPANKAKNEKALEDANYMLEKNLKKKQGYLEDKNGGAYQKDLLGNLSMIAASPFVYSKSTADMVANPYGLAREHSALDMANWEKQYARKRHDTLNDRKEMMSMFEVAPTSATVKIGKDSQGNTVNAQGAMFNAQGGYNADALAETGATLLNLADIQYSDDTTKQLSSVEKEKVIKGFKDGTSSIVYVGATATWQIITPERTIDVAADQSTANATRNLREMGKFRNENNHETQLETTISPDGKFEIPVTMTKSYKSGMDRTGISFGYKEPKIEMFTPVYNQKTKEIVTYDIKDIKKNPALLGSTRFNALHVNQIQSDGVYVISTEDYSGDLSRQMIKPIEKYNEEYDAMVKQNLSPTIAMSYIKKEGDKITVIDKIPINEAAITTNQIKLHSTKGRNFYNLTKQNKNQMISIYNATKTSDSEGTGTSQNTDDQTNPVK